MWDRQKKMPTQERHQPQCSVSFRALLAPKYTSLRKPLTAFFSLFSEHQVLMYYKPGGQVRITSYPLLRKRSDHFPSTCTEIRKQRETTWAGEPSQIQTLHSLFAQNMWLAVVEPRARDTFIYSLWPLSLFHTEPYKLQWTSAVSTQQEPWIDPFSLKKWWGFQ